MLKMTEIRERLRAHPNLAEAARHLKVTRSYLSYIANNRRDNPSTDLRERMSDYLTSLPYIKKEDTRNDA